MSPRILPSGAGQAYSPAQLELREIPEERRAIYIWRKMREHLEAEEAEGEGEEEEKERGADAQAPSEGEAGAAAMGGGAAEPSGPEAPAAEEEPPAAPHPDFEPITRPEGKERGPFRPLGVSPQAGPDGAFSIVTEEERLSEEEAEKTAAQRREELLAEARAQAAKLREDATSQGYQKGYSEGMTQARQEILAELKPVLEEFVRTNQGLLNYRGEILKAAEEEIFELALLIGKKILHAELRLHPEAVLSVVRHALRRAVGWGEATVYVNPEDRALIEEHVSPLNEAAQGVCVVQIEADPSIQRGGCILQSNLGEVDARIEKQHDEIEQTLREALRKKDEEEAASRGQAPPPAEQEAAPEGPAEAVGEAPEPAAEEEEPPEPFHLPELGGEPSAEGEGR